MASYDYNTLANVSRTSKTLLNVPGVLSFLFGRAFQPRQPSLACNRNFLIPITANKEHYIGSGFGSVADDSGLWLWICVDWAFLL